MHGCAMLTEIQANILTVTTVLSNYELYSEEETSFLWQGEKTCRNSCVHTHIKNIVYRVDSLEKFHS